MSQMTGCHENLVQVRNCDEKFKKIGGTLSSASSCNLFPPEAGYVKFDTHDTPNLCSSAAPTLFWTCFDRLSFKCDTRFKFGTSAFV